MKYDEDLLQVLSVGKTGGRAVTFDIVPIAPARGRLETRVVFEVRKNETRELVVQLRPSGSF